MKTAIAIRHVSFEDLGTFAAPLSDAGYVIRYVDACTEHLLELDPIQPDLIIVLGGPISVYEEETYPFLADEIQLLQQRLAADRPTLGICLGAQLIARAMGARVYPGRRKEIGFSPITLTAAGRSSWLSDFLDEPMTLHWHGDTFDLPIDAIRLASTELCENQAFSLGSRVLGVQFHPEVDVDMFERWLVGHAVELATAGLDVVRLRHEARLHGPDLRRKAQSTLSKWLSSLRD